MKELDRDGIDAVLATDFIGLNRLSLDCRSPFSPIRTYADPITWLSALASHTRRIGLITTVSTQFNQPYNTARQLASLDNISGGRAGWNIVTSFSGETNFGDKGLLGPAERYEQAQEFLDVTTALWHSWKDGFHHARADGAHVLLSDRIADINHAGKYYHVQQALDVLPSRQRDPLIVQAGSSESGIEFAARNAELVFFAAPKPEASREYYRKLKSLAVSYGRKREDIRLILGMRIYLGRTSEEARRAYDALVSDEDFITARHEIRWELPGLDLDGLQLDDKLPLSRFPSAEDIKAYGRRSSRPLLYRSWVESGEVGTLRELLRKFHNARGHIELVGAIDEVADRLTDWFQNEFMDGVFVIGSNSYSLFSEQLLPALRRRGVRPEAGGPDEEGTTLRARLGTSRGPLASASPDAGAPNQMRSGG
ncbi:NtaA/DmoA family FMN-dependent monooxygenase [Bradyrhizobium sp.]|uniref:NtaA/DmoA family FMN-dependent monooxygenase n=1 Tax=Bradyrhizobium sp. TaxID=376 RepID=UPI0039E2E45F